MPLDVRVVAENVLCFVLSALVRTHFAVETRKKVNETNLRSSANGRKDKICACATTATKSRSALR